MLLRFEIGSHDGQPQFKGHIHTGRPGTAKIQFHQGQIVERITTAKDEFHDSIQTPFSSRQLKRNMRVNPNEHTPVM
jgi:hypothetical protein